MRSRSLTDKLAVLYAGLFSAILLLLSIIIIIAAYFSLINNESAFLQDTLTSFFEHAEKELALGLDIGDEGILHGQSYGLNSYLFTPDGALIVASENFPVDLPEDRQPASSPYSFRGSDGGRFMLHSGKIDENDGAGAEIVLVASLADIGRTTSMLAGLLLAANILGIAAAIFVGRYVSRRMFAPVKAIIRETRSIDSRHLDRRVPVPAAQDELQELALTINNMMHRVESAFARQRRFVADASHEMRTPLSILRGYADLLRRWGFGDPIIVAESMDALDAQIAYMQELIEKLLFLAREDSEAVALAKEDIELLPYMRQICEEQSIADPGHSYPFETPDALTLHADPLFLRQLLLALFDNSRKHAPEGGVIQLSAEERDSAVVLCVADNGAGMNPEHIEHIFDRFYRVDKARSRENGGSGLGLSIAQSIMRLHKGEISAWSRPNEGTKILLEFPKTSRMIAKK